MASSTKRPKSKPGQPEGKAPAVNKDAAQPASSAAQPASKPTNQSNQESKTATLTKTPGATVVAKASPSASKAPQSPANRQEVKRQAKREEINRRIEERRLQRERERRNRLARRWAIWGSTSLLVAGLIAFIVVKVFFGPMVAPYLTGATIDGIQCNAGEQLQTHYHTQLQMYVNGQLQAFPSDAGRQSNTGCFYWLHTHQNDGIVHVEVPSNGTYTLGQFFDIAGMQVTSTNLLGHKVDSNNKMTIYVFNPTQDQLNQKDQAAQAAAAQGQSAQPFTVTPPSDLKPYTGDPRKIQLKPNEVVYIEIGTVVQPQAYTFASGL